MARLDDSNERAELDLAEAQRASAEAQVAELDAVLTHARQELARTRALARDRLASESQMDQRVTDVDTLHARVERAHREIEVAARRVQLHQTRLADLTIRAPFAGVVIEKSVQPGEMISPVSAGGGFTRTGIGTIVDMDSLEVEVDVNEAYINRVAVDQGVEITLNAYPDRTYRGRVLAVIPTADRSKATIRVRIGFANVDAQVLPEMGIKAAFLD
jgi:RND family efflux transporter MFP subunit